MVMVEGVAEVARWDDCVCMVVVLVLVVVIGGNGGDNSGGGEVRY